MLAALVRLFATHTHGTALAHAVGLWETEQPIADRPHPDEQRRLQLVPQHHACSHVRCCRGGGWDMVSLAAFVFLRGRYTSPAAVAHTWLPWAVLVALGVSGGRPLGF